jgi:GxxExxY protein
VSLVVKDFFFAVVTYDLDSTVLIDDYRWLEVCHGHCPDQSNYAATGQSCGNNGAMTVHTELGPGLLESTYTARLQYELKRAGFLSATQVALPLVYQEVKLELGYRMDLLVQDLVVVEIKSVDGHPPVHQAQNLSYP